MSHGAMTTRYIERYVAGMNLSMRLVRQTVRTGRSVAMPEPHGRSAREKQQSGTGALSEGSTELWDSWEPATDDLGGFKRRS